MNWKDQIPACFGSVDHILASHTKDEERAKKMMKDAFASGASIEELLTAISGHLRSNSCPEDHIEKQLAEVRNLRFGV